MSGLISKNKLIMELAYWLLNETPGERTDEAERDYQEIVCEVIRNCIATVEEQPPVEPVRGEWIEGAEYMDSEGVVNQEVFCSVCSASASYTLDPPNFCSNCGCYMRGEKND